MTKNTPLFPVLHFFAPLNDVWVYIAWSWKTTLIMWFFFFFFNEDDIQLQIQAVLLGSLLTYSLMVLQLCDLYLLFKSVYLSSFSVIQGDV